MNNFPEIRSVENGVGNGLLFRGPNEVFHLLIRIHKVFPVCDEDRVEPLVFTVIVDAAQQLRPVQPGAVHIVEHQDDSFFLFGNVVLHDRCGHNIIQ